MSKFARFWIIGFGLLLAGQLSFASEPTARKTENVIFVMTDGLRWQEVFGGADDRLMNKESCGVKDVELLKRSFWRVTPESRREALMPFLWSVIGKQGQLFGNRRKGSEATVTNGKNFSYPGYSETLCGFADPRIDSNAKRPNPNVTVLEWLHKKKGFTSRVAAFGAWDVFPSIFNVERCGFPVNAGYDPLVVGKKTPQIELLNRLKLELPRYWEGEPYDSLTFHTAFEYLKVNRPRVLFLSLGETDEWAHEGKYDEYLVSAQRVDGYLRQIWQFIESDPQYRGRTTLIFSPDHGRGDAPAGWKSHGADVKGSENIWMAFLGPDTAPLGERTNVAPITQSQLAATLAKLLGHDYLASIPRAGKPISDVLPASSR